MTFNSPVGQPWKGMRKAFVFSIKPLKPAPRIQMKNLPIAKQRGFITLPHMKSPRWKQDRHHQVVHVIFICQASQLVNGLTGAWGIRALPMGQTAHDHQWLLPGIKVQEVWPQFLLGPKMARSYWKMIQGYQIFRNLKILQFLKYKDTPPI